MDNPIIEAFAVMGALFGGAFVVCFYALLAVMAFSNGVRR